MKLVIRDIDSPNNVYKMGEFNKYMDILDGNST